MRLEWNGVLDMRMKSRKSADPILVRMLGKVSLVTLQKAVVYGAALSVTGSSILYYMTQRRLSSGPYFTEAVAVLKGDEHACELLGKPVRVKALKLGDKENQITTQHAQVLIPVAGSRMSGILKSTATVRNGKWELDSIILQLNNKSDELKIALK